MQRMITEALRLIGLMRPPVRVDAPIDHAEEIAAVQRRQAAAAAAIAAIEAEAEIARVKAARRGRGSRGGAS